MSDLEQRAERQVFPGEPFPLGAIWDGNGTNFSLFSAHAEGVVLCLFDDGAEEQIELSRGEAHNWHCYLPGVGPGQCYGFRVHGPYDPESGARFNPRSSSSTPTRKRSTGSPTGTAPTSCPTCPTGPRTPTSKPTTKTTRRRCRARSSPTRPSTGRGSSRRTRAGPRR